jgi:2-polyprenyl-3-methyl-5-hydroxy-6-metoxy-1,4-benzoquinol methylase
MFCPVCNHKEYSKLLTVKDFTVSSENFEVVECTSCGFRYTAHPPAPDQIGRYYQSDAYISHTDSKKGLFNTIYQLIRKQAVASKRKLVACYSQRQTGQLLDYGCGTGAFLVEMKLAGWQVQGMEPDPGAASRAAELTASVIRNPDQLASLPEKAFDVVTMWHVLEHVHDLHGTLDHVKRILKQDGILIVAVPNHTSFDARHYTADWAAYDVPRHLHHFSPDSLSKLMQMHSMKVKSIKPMWYDAFYVSLLSEKYKTGSMRLIPAVLTGIISNINAIFKKGVCSSQIYIISA